MIEQYEILHRQKRYGTTATAKLPWIRSHVRVLGARSIIDYGAGQSLLHLHLEQVPGVSVTRYDPAIPEIATLPEGVFDLLVNVDVLEHIPESQLDEVLADMRRRCRHALLVIDTVPARQILPNGENAHCTVYPAAWWRARLEPIFGPLTAIRAGSRRRAAFITARYGPLARLRLAFLVGRERFAVWRHRRRTGKPLPKLARPR